MAKESDVYSPELLLEAAQVLCRSLSAASPETLETAHALIGRYLHAVVDAAGGSLENAAEQRVLGILWAEIEIALDARRQR